MKNKNIEDYPEDWEPDWLDPTNDRKTPYTEEELKDTIMNAQNRPS